jgi:hypothetical protein
MMYFVLWISINGQWFLGPDYRDPVACETAAAKIRTAAPEVKVICGPRGMP